MTTPTDDRRRVDSGTKWEAVAGYCRAIRVGDRILVSGTVAVDPEGNLVGLDNAGAQTRYIIDKIEAAIMELDGTLADVVRTRMFVADIYNWERVAKAHGDRFGPIRPVTTLVQAQLIGPEFLVEIEAEAVVKG